MAPLQDCDGAMQRWNTDISGLSIRCNRQYRVSKSSAWSCKCGSRPRQAQSNFVSAGFLSASCRVVVVNSDDQTRVRCLRHAHPGHSQQKYTSRHHPRVDGTRRLLVPRRSRRWETLGLSRSAQQHHAKKVLGGLQAQSNIHAQLVQRPPSLKAGSSFLLYMVRSKLLVAILDGDG